MFKYKDLTPEEKAKLNRILFGLAIFAGAYLGAKQGVNTAMQKGVLRVHLIDSNGVETVCEKLK